MPPPLPARNLDHFWPGRKDQCGANRFRRVNARQGRRGIAPAGRHKASAPPLAVSVPSDQSCSRRSAPIRGSPPTGPPARKLRSAPAPPHAMRPTIGTSARLPIANSSANTRSLRIVSTCCAISACSVEEKSAAALLRKRSIADLRAAAGISGKDCISRCTMRPRARAFCRSAAEPACAVPAISSSNADDGEIRVGRGASGARRLPKP